MKNFATNWKTKDGILIYAQGWKPEVSPKALICLFHGIGEHTSRYKDVAKVVTNSGYVLFGADMRGHGRSGGKRGHYPSKKAILEDIDQVLQQGRNMFPEVPVFIYGHSLGGINVLFYSLQQHPDINGVIATSPGLKTALEKQQVKVFAAKLLGTLFPKFSLTSGLDPHTLTRNEKAVQDYLNDPLVHHKMTLGFGKIMLEINHWTMKHAGEFSLPLLLMHGKADELTYSSGSVDFAAQLHNNCKLVLWDNALHELHKEPEKEKVLATITNWIEKQLS